MIRTLIVDDERLARARLTRLLKDRPELHILGTANDGDEAVAMIAELKPDLVFLDVQMPGLSGFDVLGAIGTDAPMPFLIFVTAFDEYALRAFEVHALDYLLKPFDAERLNAAVDRAVAIIRGIQTRPAQDEVLEKLAPLRRFVVRAPGRIVFLAVDEVDWIEAADNYVYLHAGRERHLLRATLKSLESQLDDFARIHRSVIVNLGRIREVVRRPHGDCEVVLRDGTRLAASRTFARRLTTA